MFRIIKALMIATFETWVVMLSSKKTVFLVFIPAAAVLFIIVNFEEAPLLLKGIIVFIGALSCLAGIENLRKEVMENAWDAHLELARAILEPLNNENKEKETIISLTYLSAMKRKNIFAKSMLFTSFFILGIIYLITNRSELGVFCFVSFVSLFLIILKEEIVGFRIKKGIFGTNKYEAKELIEFLLNNSEDIDFHDDQGRSRKIFVSEAEDLKTKQRPFIQGAKTQ